jgi:hypothetical protein
VIVQGVPLNPTTIYEKENEYLGEISIEDLCGGSLGGVGVREIALSGVRYESEANGSYIRGTAPIRWTE